MKDSFDNDVLRLRERSQGFRSGRKSGEGVRESDLLRAFGGVWLFLAVLVSLLGLATRALGIIWPATALIVAVIGVCLANSLLLSSVSEYGLARLWAISKYLLDGLWLVLLVVSAAGMSLALLG